MNDTAEVNNLCTAPVREPLAAPIGAFWVRRSYEKGWGGLRSSSRPTIAKEIPCVRFTAEFFAMSQTLLWERHIAVPSPRARHSPLSN